MTKGMKSQYARVLQDLIGVLTTNSVLIVGALADLDNRYPCVCISPQNPRLSITQEVRQVS